MTLRQRLDATQWNAYRTLDLLKRVYHEAKMGTALERDVRECIEEVTGEPANKP